MPTANKRPISVSRDHDIKEAITIMMAKDYSQLPVMQNDWKVDGYISWRSIGEVYALGKECKTVRNCIKHEPVILEDNTDLLEAIRRIISKDFILVKSKEKDNKIIGIVSTWDITTSFIELAEPFLLIGKIENNIRQLIDTHFSQNEIKAIQNPDYLKREINSASDLTFGEYIRLLENEKKWNRFSKYKISRSCFIKYLQEVNDIRNEIMHFRQIGIQKNHADSLRKMSMFLEQLCCVLPK